MIDIDCVAAVYVPHTNYSGKTLYAMPLQTENVENKNYAHTGGPRCKLLSVKELILYPLLKEKKSLFETDNITVPTAIPMPINSRVVRLLISNKVFAQCECSPDEYG